MDILTNNPHTFFWISIIVILGLGFINPEAAIDINLHDTYFVISHWALFELLSLVFGGIGLVYWGLLKNNFKLTDWMTITHLICSIDTLIFVWLTLSFNWFISNQDPMFDDLRNQNVVLTICFILFFMGQILFLLNVCYSFIRRIRSKSVN